MSEKIYIVKLNGYGYKNGNVYIDKSLEFDKFDEYKKFLGANRYDEVSRVISYHYPNVDFDPKKITIHTNSVIEPKSKKESNALLAGAVLAGKILENTNSAKKEINQKDLRRLESKKRSDERIKERRNSKKDNEEKILENEIFGTLSKNPSQKKGINKLIPIGGLILMFLILLLIAWMRKN